MTAVTPSTPQHTISLTTRLARGLARWLWILPVLAFLALGYFIVARPIQVLPRITLSPGYLLFDQQGNRLTSEDMRGKITLYTFTYTACQSPCLATSPFLQTLQARLPELEPSDMPIEFVTISIDPERDTPEVLAAYAHDLGADLETWHFVTGTPERLKWVIGGGFGVYYDRRDDGTLALDTAVMLVDWTGTLRAEYRRSLPDMEIVMRDLRLLQQELNNAEGAGRLAYEAAHLFACYPR